MVEWATRLPRCSLFAGMGSGKTSGTLMILEALRLAGELEGPTLVLGPMRVIRDTWPDEAKKWLQTEHFTIVPLIGTPAKRKELLREKANIYTLSYENLPWLVDLLGARWPFRQVVADESDRLRGFRLRGGGERAKNAARVAHTLVHRWINLTGLPTPNGLQDLWGQLWYLDRGRRLGSSYTAFKQRWFKPTWSGYGIEPMPYAEKQIIGAIKDICLTLDPKDYFSLKEPNFIKVPVKLPPAARKIYRDMDNKLFADLESGAQLLAPNEGSSMMKCMQIANGAVYTTYPDWEQIHDAKLDALDSCLAESGGGQVLVQYQFKSDSARIRKRFPDAVELAYAGHFATFRAGRARIGIAHPKSLGHGVDGLQYNTATLIRFGRGRAAGDEQQMLERIGPMRQFQAGLERPVMVYDIVAENTVDEDIVEDNSSKLSLADRVMAGCKRRHESRDS